MTRDIFTPPWTVAAEVNLTTTTGISDTYQLFPYVTSGASLTLSQRHFELLLRQVAQNKRLGDAYSAWTEANRQAEAERQAAQRREYEAMMAVRREEARKDAERQAEAAARALALVNDVLSPEDFATYNEWVKGGPYGWVKVFNEKSGRLYAVKRGNRVIAYYARQEHLAYMLFRNKPLNDVIKQGYFTASSSICIVVRETVPYEDAFLAQYLVCKYDDEYLHRVGFTN